MLALVGLARLLSSQLFAAVLPPRFESRSGLGMRQRLPFYLAPALPSNDTRFLLGQLNHSPSLSLSLDYLILHSFVLYLNLPRFLVVRLPKIITAALQPAPACVYRLFIMAIATIGAPVKWVQPKASTWAQQDQSNKSRGLEDQEDHVILIGVESIRMVKLSGVRAMRICHRSRYDRKAHRAFK